MIKSCAYFWRVIRQELLRANPLLHAQNEEFSPPLASICVVAPHPDDEVLGCGGLIARAIEEGRKINVLLLTGGGASHRGCCEISNDIVKKKRRELAKEALVILGLSPKQIIFLDWGDGGLPHFGQGDFVSRVDELSTLFAVLKPANIFCPHPFEGWSDHVATQAITRAAIQRSGIKSTLYYYCVWFWYAMPLRKGMMCDWRNAVALDIRDVWYLKQKGIDEYMKPLAPCGNPWSGVLPKGLVTAFQWKKELFFKAGPIGRSYDPMEF